MAKAMRVISAAKKEMIDASNVMVIWVDKDIIRATKVTAVADFELTKWVKKNHSETTYQLGERQVLGSMHCQW